MMVGSPSVRKCPDGRRFSCPGGTQDCVDNLEAQCKQPFPWMQDSELVEGEMCIKLEQSVCTPDMQNKLCLAFPDMCASYSAACDKMNASDIALDMEAKFCLKVLEPLCSADVVEQVCTIPGGDTACEAIQMHCGGKAVRPTLIPSQNPVP